MAVRSTPVKIGLETAELNNAGRLTLDGTILGTPQYISPEQLEGRLLLENEHARVFDVHVKPGERVATHAHPLGVIFA
jgi:quercetin dioxygenase-like cupin family protein